MFSVTLRNISVHLSKNNYLEESWYFGVQIDFTSQCLPYIETLKMFRTPGNYLEKSKNFALNKREEPRT